MLVSLWTTIIPLIYWVATGKDYNDLVENIMKKI